MRPAAGARVMCTSRIDRKVEMRTRCSGPSPSSTGGRTVSTAAMRPSAGGDDQALAQRRHAVGIAEEIGDPQGDDHEQPGERRPQEEEEQRQPHGDGDELVAVAMHGRQTVDDGVKDAVTFRHERRASLNGVLWPCRR